MPIETRECPVCNRKSGKNTKKHVNGLMYYQCDGCSLYYQSPYKTVEELDKFYRNEYIVDFGDDFDAYMDRRHRRGNRIRHRITDFSKEDRILEIGCGDGKTAFMLKQLGFNIEAVETYHRYVKWLRKKGLTVYDSLFENMDIKPELFDKVLLFEVLEHSIRPIVMMDKIYSILKPQGKLYMSTPIWPENDLMDLSAFKVPHFMVFTVRSLKLLLKKYNYTEIEPVKQSGASKNFIIVLQKAV